MAEQKPVCPSCGAEYESEDVARLHHAQEHEAEPEPETPDPAEEITPEQPETPETPAPEPAPAVNKWATVFDELGR